MKTVQPNVVIVEVDADKGDKKEVRLPLNQSHIWGPLGKAIKWSLLSHPVAQRLQFNH